jgi:hypothetical protein
MFRNVQRGKVATQPATPSRGSDKSKVLATIEKFIQVRQGSTGVDTTPTRPYPPDHQMRPLTPKAKGKSIYDNPPRPLEITISPAYPQQPYEPRTSPHFYGTNISGYTSSITASPAPNAQFETPSRPIQSRTPIKKSDHIQQPLATPSTAAQRSHINPTLTSPSNSNPRGVTSPQSAQQSEKPPSLVYGFKIETGRQGIEEIITWPSILHTDATLIADYLQAKKRFGADQPSKTMKNWVESLPVTQEIYLYDTKKLLKIRDGTIRKRDRVQAGASPSPVRVLKF